MISCRAAFFMRFLGAAMALHVVAANPSETYAENVPGFDDAIALHNDARDGNSRALKKAVGLLERLREEHPGNAEVAAYLGSVYAISARDGRNVVGKMRNANRGLRELDRAAELEPGNFTVRMVRAHVQMSLPAMFLRQDDAIEDMRVLHEIFTATPAPSPGMAGQMVPIYDALIKQADGPDRKNFAEGRERALRIAS